MTTLEYQTLMFSPDFFFSLEDFTEYIKIRESGWKKGLLNILKVCEEKELYEYCAVIKKELDKEKEAQETS